jgi:uncharacterized integral membrane protein
MQVFFWLAFLVALGLAIFMVQNSTAPPVVMNFLFWKYETSLLYTILGAIGSGMLIVLLMWIPNAIRSSFRTRNLKKEIQILEREMKHQKQTDKPAEI